MVSTLDSESSDPSSNLGRTCFSNVIVNGARLSLNQVTHAWRRERSRWVYLESLQENLQCT